MRLPFWNEEELSAPFAAKSTSARPLPVRLVDEPPRLVDPPEPLEPEPILDVVGAAWCDISVTRRTRATSLDRCIVHDGVFRVRTPW